MPKFSGKSEQAGFELTKATHGDKTHVMITLGLLEAIYLNKAQAVIFPQLNRKELRVLNVFLYCYRHLVDNAFEKLKRWRGIATKYTKRSDSFLSAVQIRCLFLWLKTL